MKLLAFNIQNYRSIIHSGWSNLAHDNITALIGQNESGKTSVLEALQSFYDGIIYEDVLRSDLSLPIVHCKFGMHKRNVAEMLDIQKIPPPLLDILSTKNEFVLTRKWNEQRKSVIYLADDVIVNFYEARELEKSKIEDNVLKEINNVLELANLNFKDIEIAEKENEEARKLLSIKQKQLEEAKRLLKKASRTEEKLIVEKKLDIAQSEFNEAQENFQEKLKVFEILKQKAQEFSEKVTICKACNDSLQLIFDAQTELEVQRSRFKDAEHKFEATTNQKDQKSAAKIFELAQLALTAAQNKYKRASQHADLLKAIAIKVLEGQKYNQAEIDAKKELEKEAHYYSLFEMEIHLIRVYPRI